METKMNGKIRVVDRNKKHKKDVEKYVGKLTIMNTDGDKASIQFSAVSEVEGFNPEDDVEIIIRRVQQTLSESLPEKKRKK